MQALLDAIAAMPLPTDAQRIFHGRGGPYPGCEAWTLDVFPPVFVLTSFAPATEAQLDAVAAALQARWAQLAPGQALNWVFQHRGEALRLEGRSDTRLMAGSVPEPHVVTEDGARYRVHDALNLRVAGGIGAERLLVVPAGARVEATGRRDGDWWQVRATVDGETVEGWASSLWLRRADEGRVTGS